jgi:FeS assembly SUF system regulator
MIRLSRLADYAVVLMTHMASGHGADASGVHNALDMAAVTGLPAPTVAKVLAILTRQGLLQSHRGAKGGYWLARGSGEISVADIVSALEGPIALTHCIKVGPGSCDVEPTCPSRYSLNRVNTAVRKALSEMSLAEIAAPSPYDFGVSRGAAAPQGPSAAI